MASTVKHENFNENISRPKLPKHVLKDGAKWLMMPSKIMLDGLSAWPERQNKTTFVLHFLVVISYAFLIVGNFYYVADKDTDLGSSLYSISMIIVGIETVGRRIVCYRYRENLSKILSKVYFEFWPSTTMGDELHKEISKNSKDLFIFWSMEMFSAFVCGLQYVILPILSDNTPLRTAYPFAWKESPYYGILYVWQSFLALELVFNILALDLFFVSLLSNCIAQFKLLRAFLQTELEKTMRQTENASAHNRNEAVNVVLTCINHHEKLISVCKEIEEAFTLLILIQFLTSMATVCISGFTATAVPEVIGNSITYLMGHLFEILLYCYMGHELTFQSTELSDTAFHCGWHLFHGDRDLQKTLMMIMVRTQKPIRISAGGFGYLSLQTFLKLIQFSFSVFTLLIKMDNKQKH